MQPRSFLAILACALILATAIPGAAMADDYQYKSSEEVKRMIDAEEPMHLVDIQVEGEFEKHHLPGAVPTYAYPLKSEQEKARVDAVIEEIQADDAPVVIVCPRGGGGAKRCYIHLTSRGVDGIRLFILEKGQEGWPFEQYIESE